MSTQEAAETQPALASPDFARILVIEDEEDFALVLMEALSGCGHSVLRARSIEEARQFLQTKPELVLLDIILPDGNGLDLLAEIRRESSLADLPVILVSVLDKTEQVVRGLSMGANDYVAKPIDFPVLAARVNTQLALCRLNNARRAFLRIASHDLRSPLGTIQSLVELVMDSPLMQREEARESRQLLGTVGTTVRQMLDVVDSFLGIQSLDRGDVDLAFELVNLNDVAREVVERNQPQAFRKGIELRTEFEGDLPLLVIDSHRMSQVVQNLVDNAIKFNGNRSQVTVRTLHDAYNVTLEVQDEGPGLTDDDMKKLFEQGARLSNRPTGGEKSLSLGLWIARKLVLLHGGRIGVRRNVGTGVTFWFTLPLGSS